jgi:hypothetical protein
MLPEFEVMVWAAEGDIWTGEAVRRPPVVVVPLMVYVAEATAILRVVAAVLPRVTVELPAALKVTVNCALGPLAALGSQLNVMLLLDRCK